MNKVHKVCPMFIVCEEKECEFYKPVKMPDYDHIICMEHYHSHGNVTQIPAHHHGIAIRRGYVGRYIFQDDKIFELAEVDVEEEGKDTPSI